MDKKRAHDRTRGGRNLIYVQDTGDDEEKRTWYRAPYRFRMGKGRLNVDE